MGFINNHTFHIPVMGIGYTIDTPVRVAQYGISSAISLVDDMIMEKLREFYCSKFNKPFQAISDLLEDHRAQRITAYLNMIDSIVQEKFDALVNSFLEKGEELEKYMEMLPELSLIKQKFDRLVKTGSIRNVLHIWVKENLSPGSIDVNIMTKLDKENYLKGQKLPAEYNDAHAALRGFATSNLRSSIVLSAGMNPKLYSYMERFEDFYPGNDGQLKKTIILKVSDYRSAIIQGKFLAKKGLWVSEYRVESGLNCGGHAFATDGFLMGPILEKFRNDRDVLIRETHDIYVEALRNKGRWHPEEPLPVKFSAQGGVGTAEEHEFLLDYYRLDSVGWGSPFLLVPEATNVDDHTLNQLSEAGEEDLYLSNTSPLGIPFNTLRGNTKDAEKTERIRQGKPGSPCPKRYASLNKEYGERGTCTASRKYQMLKIKALQDQNPDEEAYRKEYDKIVEKSCICVGLGTASLLVNSLDTKLEGKGVSVCPGPNMAYFSRKVSLREMVGHIYGKNNIITVKKRPHMFLKEVKVYIDFLRNRLEETPRPYDEKQAGYFRDFRINLQDGIRYYKELFSGRGRKFNSIAAKVLKGLATLEKELTELPVPEKQAIRLSGKEVPGSKFKVQGL
jgi:hypothetical protein